MFLSVIREKRGPVLQCMFDTWSVWAPSPLVTLCFFLPSHELISDADLAIVKNISLSKIFG